MHKMFDTHLKMSSSRARASSRSGCASPHTISPHSCRTCCTGNEMNDCVGTLTCAACLWVLASGVDAQVVHKPWRAGGRVTARRGGAQCSTSIESLRGGKHARIVGTRALGDWLCDRPKYLVKRRHADSSIHRAQALPPSLHFRQHPLNSLVELSTRHESASHDGSSARRGGCQRAGTARH